jgi:septal ring factor EnvC (AmiA/AmiB activator)
VFIHAPLLASPRTHPLHTTTAKGSQMHENKTAPNNQNIVLTMSELISDEAKKSATRADVMMLAVTTETEFSKLRSWISARFDTVEADFAKVDARFDKVDAEFAKVDARFDKVDAEFAKVDARFDKVDARFDKMSSENTHNTNQLHRRNTAQVLSIAISAVGVVVALVANIIS